ncbi:hypothetical protein [Mesorhizobium sp. B2-6-5]|uniref:hypothetical protein n=1 Tax=Mesorhizobium sp. B2-6-5 TaxID=2589912 RepID=UPI001129E085|nr:hypothetical protein [Mesorhizobium sp. B2-6-5]TPJ36044.1 hypothetical protein FJ432_27345 [Mesorhizobium sp. B2-6-5]
MSAIVFDHAGSDTKRPARDSATEIAISSREEEFRSRLDGYLADYLTNHAVKTDEENCGPRVARSAMIWQPAGRIRRLAREFTRYARRRTLLHLERHLFGERGVRRSDGAVAQRN